jgi:hypothetical protein
MDGSRATFLGVRISQTGGRCMADYYINLFLDDEKTQKLEGAGLAGEIREIDGKRAVQVGVTSKEQKKLVKSFPDLTFDSSNACMLPEQAENILMNLIVAMKTLDVMKGAIMKLYNPLSGKELRAKVF